MLVLGYSKSEFELRLSCWIPESFRKVLEFFESLYQPSVPVGKTKPAGSFGSVCWNGSLGGLSFLCWSVGATTEFIKCP